MKSNKSQIYQQIHTWSELTTKKQRRRMRRPFLQLSFLRRSDKISATDMMLFFRQLATLINAGITLVNSCDILLQTQTKVAQQRLIQTLKKQLSAGKSLTSLLYQYPHYFDAFTCHLIHIGEESGKLDTLLTRLSDHKEKILALKNKIKQALIYPFIVLIVALCLIITMLLVVVPRFVELFQHLQGKLPLLTRLVIHLSLFLQNNLWLCVLSFLFFCCLLRFKHTFYFPKLDKLILKIPILQAFIKKTFFTQFVRSLATLSSAGIPLVDALKMMTNISKNSIFTTALSQLKNELKAGHTLHEAMLTCGIFPPLMIQMICVGEESGALDAMLTKIAELYEQETNEWINNFSHLLEPLIIIILGVLIGGIVIAMYLPIFKLGTVI